MSCNQDSSSGAHIVPPDELSVDEESNDLTSALVFKKEKKIEIWSFEKPKRLLKTLDSIETFSSEIGFYKTEIDSIQKISNYISKISNFTPSEILVLPSVPGPLGILEPCFACSFDKAGIYAKLEIHLKKYPLEKKN